MFNKFAEKLWVNEIPSGSMDIKQMPSQEDILRVADYIIKDFWRENSIEQFVLSDEFTVH